MTNTINKLRIQFLVIPLVVFSLTPFVNDSLGIPKLISLIFGTILVVIALTNQISNFSKLCYIPIFLSTYYMFLQVINPIDLSKFLLGAYSRNGGFIALFCLTMIFVLVASQVNPQIKNFKTTLNITINFVVIYSILEILNLLPYQSLTDFGGKITLTLANPNFASAFLGIVIPIKLFLIYGLSKPQKIVELGVIAYLIYVLNLTGSLQGYLVLIIGFIIFFLMIIKNKVNFNLKKATLIISCISTVILGIVLLNLENFFNLMVKSGSADFRINYWKLSYSIWADHKIFGVGIDNLGAYSTKYRDQQLSRQEGIFTVPDRSHNVFIDHFVNGGMIGGFLWLIFVLAVSYCALMNIYRKTEFSYSQDNFIPVSIWFGYVFQSLISVDHLSLTLLGFISAGFIVNFYFKTDQNPKIISNRKLFIIKNSTNVVLSLLLIFCLSVFYSERQAFLFFRDNKVINLDQFYNSRFFNPNTFEKVTIAISKSKDFSLAYRFAQKLEKHTLNNHQSKFVQSVYYESIKDYKTARDLMFEAHRLDKFNPVYTVGLALFEYRLGNKDLAIKYLNETRRLNPNQPGFKEIADFIYSNL